MRRLLALAVIALLLSACVDTVAQRVAELNPLVGQPEAELVRQLGVPTRTFETGGRRFLAYTENRVDAYPGAFTPYYGGWGPYGGYYAGGMLGPEVVVQACETTFEIADGKVVSYSLRGNAC